MAALSCVTLVRGPAAVALLLLLLRAMVVVQGINVTACCPPFRQHICHSFVKFNQVFLLLAVLSYMCSYWLPILCFKF